MSDYSEQHTVFKNLVQHKESLSCRNKFYGVVFQEILRPKFVAHKYVLVFELLKNFKCLSISISIILKLDLYNKISNFHKKNVELLEQTLAKGCG
jgi:hypothetical protein